MDFVNFPAEIHTKIFHYLDIKTFYKTACVNRKMWIRCDAHTKKDWAVVLKIPSHQVSMQEEGMTIAMMILGHRTWLSVKGKRSIDLLFRNGLVNTGYAYGQGLDNTAVKHISIYFGHEDECQVLNALKKFKPAGQKYSSLKIRNYRPTPKLVEFVNAWTDIFEFVPVCKLQDADEFLGVKVATVRVKAGPGIEYQCMARHYMKRFLEEVRSGDRVMNCLTLVDLPTRSYAVYPNQSPAPRLWERLDDAHYLEFWTHDVTDTVFSITWRYAEY
ncbi:unnamed protein product, partial [Mesorhabditis spiculigera]